MLSCKISNNSAIKYWKARGNICRYIEKTEKEKTIITVHSKDNLKLIATDDSESFREGRNNARPVFDEYRAGRGWTFQSFLALSQDFRARTLSCS
jgi:hypothetical protein